MERPEFYFGCEIEMFTGYRPVQDALDIFSAAGLCNAEELHEYHCDCEECDYSRDGMLLAAQTDVTVGAEFVTRILSNRSNRDMTELSQLRAVYGEVLDATDWYPDGSTANGNHIHVGWPSRTNERTKAKAASLIRGMMSGDARLWTESIAAGVEGGRVRGYNGTIGVPTGDYWNDSWLRSTDYDTLEFRLWNTPGDPDRLLVHPALSLAMMHWALQTIEEEDIDFASARIAADWGRTRSAPSRKRIAKIVRELWRDGRSANYAAELIAA